jgi:type II secretory pathway pseudopilin PulG
MTLLEIVVAMSVLAVALVSYARAVALASVASSTSREATLAGEAGRRMIETLRATNFAQVYSLYNDMAADDPGPGPAPGAHFAVAGLKARTGDVDGFPGEISFPTSGLPGALFLRENIADAKLGMPSDLNGDGLIDAADHAANYQVLPVLVRVRWAGVGGPGQIEFQTVLGSF